MMVVHGVSLLLAVLAVTRVNGLAFTTKSSSQSPTTSVSSVYTGLQSTPLIRASDEASVFVTDLWKARGPFGWGDETVVCAFLRHYG